MKVKIPNSIIKHLGNRYLIVGGVFFIWMLFFDTYSIITQLRYYLKIRELKNTTKFYNQEIAKTMDDQKELFSSQAKLEEYAREHYYMKRDDEDIYIVK